MVMSPRDPAFIHINNPFKGERIGLEISSTYQAILRQGYEKGRRDSRKIEYKQGRAHEARRILLRQGKMKFGPPDAPTRAAIENMVRPVELEALAVRLLSASSWAELLTQPKPKRRQRRRRSKS